MVDLFKTLHLEGFTLMDLEINKNKKEWKIQTY